MSTDDSRRFTDREVAMVLKKAADIEETEGSGAGGGLSLDDLQSIAREVGISPAAIERAVSGLEKPGEAAPFFAGLLGAPSAHKAVHSVRGELNDVAMARLIRLIDDRVDTAGAVSDALGSVRWTSSDRFASTQVAITPAGGETTIQVTEKILPKWKRVIHLLPAAWGTIIAGGAMASSNESTAIIALALGIGAALGATAGRFVWSQLSARSGSRVGRLAADLSREAYDASRSGLLLEAAGREEAP